MADTQKQTATPQRIVDVADATPRPWKRSCFLIQGPKGEHVTHTGMGNLPPSRSHESEANAELILVAVNSYEAMREAIRLTLTRYETGRDIGWAATGLPRPKDDKRPETIEALYAALALADEGK